ncbi:hypothetical protein PGB90_002137 [Kerria lacca]
MEDIQTLPRKRQRLIEEPDIRLSACDFRDVLESDCFVDKTMLIKEVLNESEECFVITAPRRFGKSINLSMLKLFLTIEVDENGQRITKSIEKPVHDTKNYRCFTSPIPKLPERKLKISKEIEILNKHLGKYPVIFVDFRGGLVQSFKDVIEKCKKVIHNSYLEHEYLCRSKKLNTYEKNICKKWCSETEYNTFDAVDVVSSLKGLSKCLFKHFDHKCFVLIDIYDSVCSTSRFQVEETAFRDIKMFYLSIFGFLLKGNKKNVCSSFITGISYIGHSNNINNVSDKFVQNRKFINFYGLTFDEVEDLGKRFSFEEGEFENFVEYYNGYECGEKKIFNMWSLISYLKFQKIKNVWKESGMVMNITDTLKILEVQSCLNTLLNHSDNTIEVDFVEKIHVDQISKLKKVLVNDLANSCIRFNFLLEHGYFAICNINENTRKVVLRSPDPYNESRSQFEQKLKIYYERLYKLNFYTVEHCFIRWNAINFNVEDSIKDNLNKICKILNIIFKSILLLRGNEATFHI